ncbi:MAG: cyclic nucleotide-binding domain-containing protein [Rhodovibrionaceae bacterium]
MTWKTYTDGEAIFREGETSEAAFLIVSGEIDIVKGYETNHARTIATVGAGEYVGEMGVVESRPRSASALAKGPTVVAPVTQAEFMELLLQNPEEAVGLIKVLFERLRAASDKLAALGEPLDH